MIKELFRKYKEVILYLFFGACTTLVKIIAYYICSHIFFMNVVPSTVIAWILSVAFAYVTNRIYVFESKADRLDDIIKEICSFVGCRLLTGGMDLLIMFVCVDIMHWNDMIIKVLSNILVIILNYLASKILIFRKK